MTYLFIVMVAENIFLAKLLLKPMFQGSEKHKSRFGISIIYFNIIIIIIGYMCYVLSNINSYLTVILFVSGVYRVFFAWVIIFITNILILCGVGNIFVENRKAKLLPSILIIALLQTMVSLYKVIDYLVLS